MPYTLVPEKNINTYVQSSTATLTFESNMFYETFENAYIDGTKMVRDKDYAATKGSTVITLANARLRTLAVGKHTLMIEGKDKETVSCDFYVSANYYADTSNPKTGDSILMAMSVMTVSAAALAVLLLGKKKRA